MKNKKNIIIASIIMILLVVSLSVTFAYLSIGGKQELGNTFSSGCLNIRIENESNAINLNNVYPITDFEGLETTPYTFTIKNTCSTPTNYQINLESLNQKENTLDDDYIKVSLSSDTNDNLISLLKDNTRVTPTITGAYQSNNLYTGIINGDTTKTFNLRIWLDYDTTAEQGESKVYSSKINVIANPKFISSTKTEVKMNLNDATGEITGVLSKEINNAKYCITKDKVCVPNTEALINNKEIKFNVNQEAEKQMVCVSLDNEKSICNEPIEYINYLVVSTFEEEAKNNVLGKVMARSSFESITTLSNKEIPSNAIESWDVSEKQNGSIMAWYTDTDSNGLYELYIGQDGGVIANPNSSGLFSQYRNVTSVDVKQFNTSNVKTMNSLFSENEKLLELDLSSFDTSNVTNMAGMFIRNKALTKLNLSSFDTSNATSMLWMFDETLSLTELDLSSFDTSKVTDMRWMFQGMQSLESLDLSHFNTSKVTDMTGMFQGMSNLKHLNISNFNTSKVTDMSWMFSSDEKLLELDLSSFDTSNVTNMYAMFHGVTSLRSLNVSNFNTSKVTDMSNMFSYDEKLLELDLSSFDTSNVTSMVGMFYRVSALEKLDLSNFNTSNVISMESMFSEMKSLTNLSISNFDTSKVINMRGLLNGLYLVESLDLRNFNTSNVTNMEAMFADDLNLKTLYLNNFDFSSVKTYDYIVPEDDTLYKFFCNTNINTIYVKDNVAKEFVEARLNDVGKTANVIIAS